MDSERRRRVLIVDDEANQRSALARMVERWGFVAETAADGQEALDKLPLFELPLGRENADGRGPLA